MIFSNDAHGHHQAVPSLPDASGVWFRPGSVPIAGVGATTLADRPAAKVNMQGAQLSDVAVEDRIRNQLYGISGGRFGAPIGTPARGMFRGHPGVAGTPGRKRGVFYKHPPPPHGTPAPPGRTPFAPPRTVNVGAHPPTNNFQTPFHQLAHLTEPSSHA